ncbi:translation initiation factor IF-2, mitochondrial-like [Haliotis rufescens]|uniref:translation initiation factor IF-2, mitochondrial-like n=1 Tax=Haliotis rufescens TaxID=6454 RepID=UPI00201F6026|nr:translation initiation factor IF-2, mitochondrial-like [Haliotis rufescens]XP_046336393.2 translation initiation factor IF-2, mitochondrial-like [Haliotis rufescens]
MSYPQASRLLFAGPIQKWRFMSSWKQYRHSQRTASILIQKQIQTTRQCLWCQSVYLHNSPALHAARKDNSKKKLVKRFKVNTKGVKLKVVTIFDGMTVEELARAMDRDCDHVFEVLLYTKGGDQYDRETSVIDDFDIIKDIIKRSGMKYQIGSKEKRLKANMSTDLIRQPPPDPAQLVRRHPVVTIMGHVDHGKTTLLDSLRNSKIVEQEFGGITQHIGAFTVKLSTGESITFLDTPGHAAFSSMRARGAQVTDIVILVVAADDGVMNQTKESIHHAKEAGVPIIVAINKVDKPEADIERTKNMLLEQQLVLEDFQGDVQAVPISALKRTNLDLLQEAIVTQAELMELKADPKGLVEGSVIEAMTDPGRGKLATVVIQRGTLKRGDLLLAGTTWAKVRGMFDDQGRPLQEAPPATPVQIIGWKDLPSAGDEVFQVENMQVLKDALQWRIEQETLKKIDENQVVIDEKRSQHDVVYKQKVQLRRESGRKYATSSQKQKETIIGYEGPQLSLVLKADVDGSLEAILDTLDTFHSKKCRLDLIHYGVGNVTETDVQLAENFSGEIFCFNVKTPESVAKVARSKSIPIKMHNVIYNLFDNLLDSLSARLPHVEEEEVLGEAEVKSVFEVTARKKKIPVAGCRCIKGALHRKQGFKVIRSNEVIYNGEIASLKHFKEEVDNVKTDMMCGISLEDPSLTFQAGDVIQCVQIKHVQQDIDWQPEF